MSDLDLGRADDGQVERERSDADGALSMRTRFGSVKVEDELGARVYDRRGLPIARFRIDVAVEP